MKNGIQKSSSLILALLVLVSTFSFTIDKHFCGDFLVDQAVFSKAKDCGMSSHNMDSMMVSDMLSDSCCTNTQLAIEGQDELKISFDNLNFDQQVFVAAFTFSIIELFEGTPELVIPFKDYSPPILVTDIHLLDQVFLI
ncbi:hypothetical protein BC962_0026 [Gillisia mitskevichiae]|uniref:Secreted protein n=1 Tax=Gillisia mitskevichiae TaxID=270921 RepID=A0A495PXF7_9FLAO|nr:hypothetical protein [Gillisia mitskevichiae]RKS55071.1 hypothetical protein BC962_0026 [Gillisia mitskevichiae]